VNLYNLTHCRKPQIIRQFPCIMGAQISRQRAGRDRVTTEHGERETEGDASMHKKKRYFLEHKRQGLGNGKK
jgi:hypothetical protein